MKKGIFLILFAIALVSFGQISKVLAYSIDSVTSTVSTSSAQISWVTDQPSYNNNVIYGTMHGQLSGSIMAYLSCNGQYSTSPQTSTTNPCIKIVNLTPGTIYYYRISSTFSNYISSISETLNTITSTTTSSSEKSFTTLSILPTTTTVTYPTAPTNLTATIATTPLTDSNTQGHYVYLQWNNQNAIGVVTIIRSITSSSSSSSSSNQTETLLTSTISSYSDYDVTSGAYYNYKIRVCNGDLCSYSNIASISIPQLIVETIPNSPQPISISTTTNSVVLNWQDTSSNETRFKIYRSTTTTNSISIPIYVTSANTTTYTDLNLLPGNYIYSIEACNDTVCSGRSYFSPSITIASVTPVENITRPVAPTIISLATSTTPGSLEIITTLSWYSVTGADRYKILSSNTNATSTVTTSSLIVGRNLAPGTYTYYVTACNGDTNCSSSSHTSITIPQITTVVISTTPAIEHPSLPTGLRLATTTSSSANFYWSVISGLIYNVKNVATGVIYNNKTTSPYNTGTLPYGSSYYSVQACFSASSTNCSDFSSPVQITIPTPIEILKPKTPLSVNTSILTTYNNISTVRVSWADESNNEDYFKITRTPLWSTQQTTGYRTSVTPYYDDIGLSSGTYTYNIFACSNTLGCSDYTTASIVIKESPSRNLSGTVTLPDGKFVIGAKVTAYNDTKSITAITDTFGKYSLSLPGGTYTVSVVEENVINKSWIVDNNIVIISDLDKVVNFSAVPLVSTLRTVVKDELGNFIPNIGVIVSNSNNVRINTQTTDTNGITSTLINAGDYVINTIFSESLPYIPAEKQTISINNNETKVITFVLKKKDISNVFEVRGATKFDDGAPTVSFISAWSDNGGQKSTYSSGINGEFLLTLSTNDTWHISAKKDKDGKSYETTEVVVSKDNYTNPISLFFVKSDSETLPPPVIKTTAVTQSVKVEANDGASIVLPANSTNSSGSIDVQVKPTTEAPSQKSSEVISTVYDITVKNNSGTNVTTLSSEAQITLPYNDNDLRAQGINVENLVPSYFDEKIGTWVSVPKFTIDKSKKTFTLYVQHLTRFALIASADTTAPSSPTNIVTDAITPTDIKISWNNPQNDFNHVKIYRSEKLGSYGDLIAAEVFANSFIDKTFSTVAKTYYYTVRAVDNAGNESNNSNQLASTILGDKFASKNKSSSLALPPGQALVGQITRRLVLGSKGDDVTALQKALKIDGFYVTGPITGYYGKLTKNAVTRFQNYYKNEILIPNGYKTGTGIVGEATRKKINEILANNS